MDYITATTVGLLLSIIFLGFFPKLMDSWKSWWIIWIFLLIWIFLFYILELFLHWHHCKDLWHSHSCSTHKHHSEEHKNWLLMFGWTLFHNAFHWIVLFIAFSTSISFWIATTIAVLLHSIPQNVVNYIMNHNRNKYAFIWAFGWTFGSLLVLPFSDFFVENKTYVLAIISGWLLYTALADIFPEFKEKWTSFKKLKYLFFIIVWVVLFTIFEYITH
jgi:zinc and cadmium transporter